jgi:hypothetical protein
MPSSRAAVCLPGLIILVAFLIDAEPVTASPYPTVTKEDLGGERVYSPFVGRSYPDQVFFGDTHFHTEVSFDAGLVGTTLDIHDAFRLARGEKITSNTGQPVQLIRPLDFLAVTEHAEFNGLATGLRESNPLLLSDPWGKQIYELFSSGQEGRMKAFQNIIEWGTVKLENPFSDDELSRTIWQKSLETADHYYEPGRFTTLMGFEWTSTPGGDNLHRIVLFGDGADKTSQTLPFSLFDSGDPEDLWAYMAEYEERTGGNVFAIPHNGNLSNGKMFTDRTASGARINRSYVEKRAHWEPLHEMTQVKGDEETHPLLSPDDEFADFENWDVSNLSGTAPKEEWMLQHEYTRPALKLGLELGENLGVNPYKFGLIGSTDVHTGISTSREENFFGKYAHTEPSPNRHNRDVIPADDPALRILTSQESASGMIAVWARENTREELFSSMRRKEVYATTGTRISVRVFGGWDFEEEDITKADFTAQGYRRGVPMGGSLIGRPDGGSPRFLIRALRDPDGANLDRVQVIKGWLDEDGETHERIYDVAVSGGREIGADGRAREPVGSTVDVDNATFTNSIGRVMLAAQWEDPEFDPEESAFYYVRVLEIPTPRWTTYDAAFFGIARPDNVPATIQDRAYTSPIWYTP